MIGFKGLFVFFLYMRRLLHEKGKKRGKLTPRTSDDTYVFKYIPHLNCAVDLQLTEHSGSHPRCCKTAVKLFLLMEGSLLDFKVDVKLRDQTQTTLIVSRFLHNKTPSERYH